MNKLELKLMLSEHELWLDSSNRGGDQADFRNVDLSYADLRNPKHS